MTAPDGVTATENAARFVWTKLGMRASSVGHWVRTADYAALRAKLQEAETRCASMTERANRLATQYPKYAELEARLQETERDAARLSRRHAAIVGAFTGVLCGPFSDMHEYIEEVMERPVWTHEMASKEVMAQIKDAARKDFLAICAIDAALAARKGEG